MPAAICPRCGNPGYPHRQMIHGRYYIYFVHKDKATKKLRGCYIGPADGYKLVARLHEINIPHAFNIEHKFVVLEELLQYFTETCRHAPDDDDEEAKKAKSVCEEAKKAAEEFLQNLSRPQ